VRKGKKKGKENDEKKGKDEKEEKEDEDKEEEEEEEEEDEENNVKKDEKKVGGRKGKKKEKEDKGKRGKQHGKEEEEEEKEEEEDNDEKEDNEEKEDEEREEEEEDGGKEKKVKKDEKKANGRKGDKKDQEDKGDKGKKNGKDEEEEEEEKDDEREEEEEDDGKEKEVKKDEKKANGRMGKKKEQDDKGEKGKKDEEEEEEKEDEEKEEDKEKEDEKDDEEKEEEEEEEREEKGKKDEKKAKGRRGKKKDKSKWRVTRKTEIENDQGHYLKITLKLDLGGDVWIVALHDHEMLEMIKIKVTGPETYKWLATKLARDEGIPKQCLAEKTFTLACFKGEDKSKDVYHVHLKASKEGKEKEDKFEDGEQGNEEEKEEKEDEENDDEEEEEEKEDDEEQENDKVKKEKRKGNRRKGKQNEKEDQGEKAKKKGKDKEDEEEDDEEEEGDREENKDKEDEEKEEEEEHEDEEGKKKRVEKGKKKGNRRKGEKKEREDKGKKGEKKGKEREDEEEEDEEEKEEKEEKEDKDKKEDEDEEHEDEEENKKKVKKGEKKGNGRKGEKKEKDDKGKKGEKKGKDREDEEEEDGEEKEEKEEKEDKDNKEDEEEEENEDEDENKKKVKEGEKKGNRRKGEKREQDDKGKKGGKKGKDGEDEEEEDEEEKEEEEKEDEDKKEDEEEEENEDGEEKKKNVKKEEKKGNRRKAKKKGKEDQGKKGNKRGKDDEERKEEEGKEEKSKWRVSRKTEIENIDGDYLKITLKLDLGGDIWIVALHDHEMLEMIMFQVTGPETYKWLGTKFAKDGDIKKHCLNQKTFTAACFKGEDKGKDKYHLHLKAFKDGKKQAGKDSSWRVLWKTSLKTDDGALSPVALYDLGNNVWIIAFLQKDTLKTFKVLVSGPSTKLILGARYAEKFDKKCTKQETFTWTCFEGDGPKGKVDSLNMVASQVSSWSIREGTSMKFEDSWVRISLSFDLGDNVWIIGLLDNGHLKMVKLRIVGPTSYVYLSGLFTDDPASECKREPTFTEACYKGEKFKENDRPFIKLNAAMASTWSITSRTTLTGEDGTLMPVTLSADLGDNVWIVGTVDDDYLRMVRIRIRGPRASRWLATRYTNDFDEKCSKQETFSETCFKGTDPSWDEFPVRVRATQGSIWKVESDTILTIGDGTKLPVKLTLDLGSNTWILGAVDGEYLRMVKIRITSSSESTLIAARSDFMYPELCAKQKSFTSACFKGAMPTGNLWRIKLDAQQVGKGLRPPCPRFCRLQYGYLQPRRNCRKRQCCKVG